MWIKTKLQGLKVSLMGFVQAKSTKQDPGALGLKFRLLFLTNAYWQRQYKWHSNCFLPLDHVLLIRELGLFSFADTAQQMNLCAYLEAWKHCSQTKCLCEYIYKHLYVTEHIFPSMKGWVRKGWQLSSQIHLNSPHLCFSWHFLYLYHVLATCASPFFWSKPLHFLLLYAFTSTNLPERSL